jgi:hypothetical protein
MQRLLFLLLSSVLLLSACSESDNKVDAESKVETITPEQQEVLSNYVELNGKGESEQVIKNHHKTFIRSENPIEINEEIVSEYNIAILNLLNNKVDELLKLDSSIDYLYLTDENVQTIQEKKEEVVKRDIDKLMEIYENKNYDSIGEPSDYHILSNQDDQFVAVHSYLWTLKRHSEGITSVDYLMSRVDFDYSGRLKKEIQALIIKEDKFYDYIMAHKKKVNDAKLNPTIGMTEEAVIKSTWGESQSKNRTVTEKSVREQWVYSNYRYLYFQDGILISFQD